MPTNIETRTCALCETDESAVGFRDWSDHPDESISCDPTPICDRCLLIVHLQCESCGTNGHAALERQNGFHWRVRDSIIQNQFRMLHPDLARQGYSRHALAQDDERALVAWADERISESPIHTRAFWNIGDGDPLIHRTEDECTRCEDCLSSCELCGALIGSTYENEEWEILCYSCSRYECQECGNDFETAHERDRCCNLRSVFEYDFRPRFRYWEWDATNGAISSFWQSPNELFMGIELETECGDSHWEDFLSDACEDGDPDFCYGKRDGSLDSSGIELVTMPATLDAFIHRFPWQAVERWNQNGARSYHRGSCGMHVHVSRSFFSHMHLWRFVAFQLRNQSLCKRMGQRDSSSYAQWQTLGDFGKHGNSTLSAIVKGHADNGARYVAINFQNETTVELRYFRGNLRTDVIRARIEFVHALAHFTQALSARDVMNGALSELEFAAYVFEKRERYPALASWFLTNPNMGDE